ncbi:hypothetical protein [Methylobacterium durans]|uniref:hypothetical protein n=1 Tax=Methylobacterium durans TaxID=2202825 RepID=UPI0013A54DA9|nr:hypothetical protein [Methylobacterium durans]
MNDDFLKDSDLESAAATLCEVLEPWSIVSSDKISEHRRGNVWRPRALPSVGLPWPDRVLAYHWKGDGYRELQNSLSAILSDSRDLSHVLTGGATWEYEDQQRAVDLTSRVFSWGGVPSRSAIDSRAVQAVFAAALRATGVHIAIEHTKDAPWSSGWTKVAAFATAHLDHDHNTAGSPQVIWDSRVANAIRKLVDAAEARLPDSTVAQLRHDLRQIRGRGGERMGLQLPPGWAFANTLEQKWIAQRAGSRLIRHMRDALNAAPERYGKMPGAEHLGGRWTSWGVGLALFVEGY